MSKGQFAYFAVTPDRSSIRDRYNLPEFSLQNSNDAVGPVTIRMRPAHRLELTVVDAKSLLPIGDAAVELIFGSRYPGKTNAQGLIGATLNPDIWDVCVWAPQYRLETRDIDLLHESQRKVQIRLEPGFSLKGTVVDRAGNPIPDAFVWASQDKGGNGSKTEPDGTYCVYGLSRGSDVRLTCECDGFSRYEQKLTIDDDVPEASLNIVLSNSEKKEIVAVEGTVTDLVSNPIKGAVVQIGPDFPGPHPTTTTDAQGEFFLPAIPHCLVGYIAIVRADGYLRVQEKYQEAPTRSLVFRLPKGLRFSGRVVDEYGLPVAGATVAVDGWRCAPDEEVVTDANGRFCLKNLPHTATLEISKHGLGKSRFSITANEGEEVLILKPQYEILGRVIDDRTGTPLQRFNVNVRDGMSHVWPKSRISVASENGDFCIPRLDGSNDITYAIKIEADGYSTKTIKGIQPHPKGKGVRQEFSVGPSDMRIAGVVMNTEGVPLPGVEVRALIFPFGEFANTDFDWDDLTWQTSLALDDKSATTKEDGSFSVGNLSDQGELVILLFGKENSRAYFIESDLADDREHLELILANESRIVCKINRSRFPNADSIWFHQTHRDNDKIIDVPPNSEVVELRNLDPKPTEITLMDDQHKILANSVVFFDTDESNIEIAWGFEPAYKVGGTVRLGDQVPPWNTIFLAQDRARVWQTNLEEGQFLFESVSEGEYYLLLVPPSHDYDPCLSPLRHKITVKDDVFKDWVYPCLSTLSGSIVGVSEDSEIIVEGVLNDGEVYENGMNTGDLNHFKFENVPPGVFSLKVFHRGDTDLVLDDIVTRNVVEDVDLGNLSFCRGTAEIMFTKPSEATKLRMVVYLFAPDLSDKEFSEHLAVAKRRLSFEKENQCKAQALPPGNWKMLLWSDSCAVCVRPRVSSMNLAAGKLTTISIDAVQIASMWFRLAGNDYAREVWLTGPDEKTITFDRWDGMHTRWLHDHENWMLLKFGSASMLAPGNHILHLKLESGRKITKSFEIKPGDCRELMIDPFDPSCHP